MSISTVLVKKCVNELDKLHFIGFGLCYSSLFLWSGFDHYTFNKWLKAILKLVLACLVVVAISCPNKTNVDVMFTWTKWMDVKPDVFYYNTFLFTNKTGSDVPFDRKNV